MDEKLAFAKTLFEAGLGELKKRDLNAAERAFQEALRFAPGRPSIMVNLAAVLIGLRRHAEALPICASLAASDPDNVLGIINLALCEASLGQTAAALDRLNQVIAKNPKHVQAIIARAEVFIAMREFAQALADHDRVLEIDPDLVEAHLNRAHVLLAMGNGERAVAGFDNVVLRHPESADGHFGRASALHAIERHDAALKAISTALGLSPNNLNYIVKHADILRAVKQYDDALRAYDQVLKSNPDHYHALNNKGNLLREQAHPREAIAQYNLAILAARDPLDRAAALTNRATAYRDLDDFDAALIDHAEAIACVPNNPEAIQSRGATYLKMQKSTEALADYNRALAINPEHFGALTGRADSLLALRRNEAAVAQYDTVLALKPDFYQAHHTRGSALAKLDRNDEALRSYDRALEIRPDDPDVLSSKGDLLVKMGRGDEAARAYRAAIVHGGDEEFIRFRLASIGQEPIPALVPKRLVTELFDQYAVRFEEHLVKQLKYQTPELLAKRTLAFCSPEPLNILDIGCGTGLLGPYLLHRKRHLVGVDLSPRMIEKAREKQIYDELHVAELVEFLVTRTEEFDVVAAADVFVYIGDLNPVFAAVQRTLKDRGVFSFTVEKSLSENIVLSAAGRYAHSMDYIRRLARDFKFRIDEITERTIRMENGVDVKGYIAVLTSDRSL